MLLTSPSFLQLPFVNSLKKTPFLNGSSLHLPTKLPLPPTTTFTNAPPAILPVIKAMKKMQGKVVCATNDKTVAVEVVRLAPHPKYKRRVRKKKKYQAHDPDNRFKVGDVVQLEKSRPISKTKAFIALPVAARNVPKPTEAIPQELVLPMQSAQS